MSHGEGRSTRSSSFLGMPRTRLGWWSIWLALAFLVLLGVFRVYASAVQIPRPTFFSDPLNAALLLGAAGAAIAGGITGVLAAVVRRERSFAILLSVLVGGFVLLWTIGELGGH